MSTNRDTPADSSDRHPKTNQLAAYLRDRAEENGGELYVKAKFIADDVGMSTREIGARMLHLESVPDLTVEKWAYTGATTWRVETDT